jgi:hypothetical protein
MFLDFSQHRCFVHEYLDDACSSTKQKRLQRITASCDDFKTSNNGTDRIDVSRGSSNETDSCLMHSEVLYKNRRHTRLGQLWKGSQRGCILT